MLYDHLDLLSRRLHGEDGVLDRPPCRVGRALREDFILPEAADPPEEAAGPSRQDSAFADWPVHADAGQAGSAVPPAPAASAATPVPEPLPEAAPAGPLHAGAACMAESVQEPASRALDVQHAAVAGHAAWSGRVRRSRRIGTWKAGRGGSRR